MTEQISMPPSPTEYQAYLEHEVLKAEIVYEVVSTYNRAIAQPGWTDAAEYLGYAATGAAILLTPAATVTAVVAGTILVAYGTIGASAYTQQALSRQFPEAAGWYHSNDGERFDAAIQRIVFGVNAAPVEPSLEAELLKDQLKGFTTERMMRGLDVMRTPGLPGPGIAEPLEKGAKRQLDQAKERAADYKKKTRPPAKSIIKPPPIPATPPSRPATILPMPKPKLKEEAPLSGVKDPFDSDNGTTWAGSDGPHAETRYA